MEHHRLPDPVVVEEIIDKQGERRNPHRGWTRPHNQNRIKRTRNKLRRQAIRRHRMS